MRSRSAGWASGAILGAKMETNAGARSGTGKIRGSFIYLSARHAAATIRACAAAAASALNTRLCSTSLEAREPAKAVRSIHHGCSQSTRLLPKSVVQLAPCVLRSLVLCNGLHEFALLCCR